MAKGHSLTLPLWLVQKLCALKVILHIKSELRTTLIERDTKGKSAGHSAHAPRRRGWSFREAQISINYATSFKNFKTYPPSTTGLLGRTSGVGMQSVRIGVMGRMPLAILINC
ncbi:hypothetical protein F5882DRAFT_404279 [Hyaloscypha sp. PMI_1271]|nr:hypothetical protein F5882DRAFT_404279 [Hyaloscypha sp. PMI_1271]